MTGSLAAAIQSSIGSVVAGSPFAIAQSIAMGGMAGPLVAAGAVVGGTAFLISSALAGSEHSGDEAKPDGDEDGDGLGQDNDGEKPK